MGYLTDAQNATTKPVTTNISDDALVENRLTGLMSQDNPLMQQADLQGRQYAQSNGLLSSSLSAGYARRAQLDSALPIAQQDAQTYSNRDLQDGAYSQQSELNRQAFGQQLGLNEQNQNYTVENAATQQGYTQANNAQLQGYTQDNNAQLQGYTVQNAATQQGYNQANSAQNFQQQTQLNSQNNGAQLQLARENQTSTIALNTNNQIASILSDPNKSQTQRQNDINTLLSLQNSQNTVINRGGQLAIEQFTYPNSTPSNTSGPSSPDEGGNGVPPKPTTNLKPGYSWVYFPDKNKWLPRKA